MRRQLQAFTLAVLLSTGLIACGGGDGTPSDPAETPVGPTNGPATGGSTNSPPRIEPYDDAVLAAKSAAVPVAAPRPAGSPTAPLVRLAPLPPAAMDAALKSAGLGHANNTRRQVGAARELPASSTAAATTRLLGWQRTAEGRIAGAASFRSEGAASVRLGLNVGRLPAGALVRVSGADGADVAEFSGAQVLDSLARDRRAGAAGHMFWLPPVSGPQARLDVILPPGAEASQVELSVPLLSHLWVDLLRGDDVFLKNGRADTCNVDAMCRSEYLDESRSVARMVFVSEGSSFLCTGTLMADTAVSGTPWFLSARHCIGDQAAASSLVTYWFYRSSSCNSGLLSRSSVRLEGGAELLYQSSRTDTAFLRLAARPPAGVQFAGSVLTAPNAGSAVAGLHHPVGDLLKVSLGSISRYVGCTAADEPSCDLAGLEFARVIWSIGTTESGSSGSALFHRIGTRDYVHGHLYAGRASCRAPAEADYYGRLDIPYREALYRYLGDVPGAR
ncbi:endoproteinase ArgC [Ramlibacter sp. AW1]|uniref:Endoproteinase ArgC n=1 Tax=Ramlibacter aurantiacus TaxID=2801330 RepID=A0A937D771_9BURK|nr:trypsin-like peptidase domain-containing protein [Ramlibacter aurantiacus]MBL0421703.1 endoproteinase ArgC [Ramlibacter aurantiacus]